MTVPMFDIPPPTEPPPRPATRARQVGPMQPIWTKYRPKNRVACDDCLLVLHEHGGRGPYPQPARFKRISGRTALFLCYEHANHWRTDDGLGPMKGKT